MDVTGIVAKLEKALTELVTLKITTRVGADGATDQKVLRTTIDLVQGDISMQVDPWFLESSQASILQLHATREKQGADIVRSNLEAISGLVKLLPDLKQLG
jgi:hypothetical protein